MFIKLEQCLFYILLFSIPFQKRAIIWQENWYFNEWQSITLYFTDIFLMVLFGLWFFGRFNKIRRISVKNIKFSISIFKKPDLYLIIFVIISAISLKNAFSIKLGLYNLIKLLEFILFYFYVKYYAIKEFNIFYSFLVLFAGGFFQAIIAIVQFIKQSSVGFGLQLFGEGFLRPDMNGVAVFYNNLGEKIMRGYGTTPHPNILAGYLFISIFSFIAWYFYNNNAIKYRKFEFFLLACLGIVVFGFFTTFSRTAVFIFILGLCIRYIIIYFQKFKPENLIQIKTRNVFIVLVITVLIFSIFYGQEVLSRLSLSSDDEAIAYRIYYGKEAINSAVNWFGVGIGNFVNWFMAHEPYHPKWFYQPVHNIYLLVYSEIGVLGVGTFVIFLTLLFFEFIQSHSFKPSGVSILIIFLSILFIGFFDHYLWTLQQGRFIFWLTLGLLNNAYVSKIQYNH